MGDLEARSAADRDANLSKMLKTIWPDDTVNAMADFLGLSPRLCALFVKRKASAPRVIRLAVLAAFMIWIRGDGQPPTRNASYTEAA